MYIGVCGSNDNITRGGPSRSGIRAIDVETGKSTVLLNNYFGTPWGCIDDLVVHPGTGDIFFSNNGESSAGLCANSVRELTWLHRLWLGLWRI